MSNRRKGKEAWWISFYSNPNTSFQVDTFFVQSDRRPLATSYEVTDYNEPLTRHSLFNVFFIFFSFHYYSAFSFVTTGLLPFFFLSFCEDIREKKTKVGRRQIMVPCAANSKKKKKIKHSQCLVKA